MIENFLEYPKMLYIKIKSDAAFMGITHAMSAVAIFLLVVAFAPDFTNNILKTSNFWVILLAGAVTAGSALIPDLDNTQSTAKSALGFLGEALSTFFRVSSEFVQVSIRTKRDDPTPNPHRGAWHTIPAAILLGGGVWLLAGIPGRITIPLLGEIHVGELIAIIITFLIVHIALSSLAASSMRKIKKSGVFGEIFAMIFSLGFTLLIYMNIPSDTGFQWLGISITAGCIIHILGDCFTRAGAPILFPISAKLKGKFWWNTRFAKLKAGGPTETYLINALLIIVIIIAFIKLSGIIF